MRRGIRRAGDDDAAADAVVVHGHGRSGTTLLTLLLARHPDLAWISQASSQPGRPPQLAVVNRVRDVPGVSALLAGRRWEPAPQEAIDRWEHSFPGFYANDRDMTEVDADPAGIEAFRALARSTVRWHGGRRFLTKYTGYPRYGLVRAVLPGCRIVRIDRDPRAVVMSVVRERWGYKRKPEAWAALGPTGQIDRAVDRYLAWDEAVRSQEAPADVVLRYEDLVADPVAVVTGLVEAVGLPVGDRFLAALRREPVRGADERWRTELAPADLVHLEERLAATAS